MLLGRYPGLDTWTIPGGVIDPGEQPADAAVRECYEETGIIAVPEALTSVTVSGLVTHDSGDLTQHLDITFRCRATGGQPKPGDGEFQDVRWHRADALPAMPAYEQGIVDQALRCDSKPAYAFSGPPPRRPQTPGAKPAHSKLATPATSTGARIHDDHWSQIT